MTTEQALKNIEERCARAVCGGGYITKPEADLLWKLRTELGKSWDAVNGRWQALEAA